MENIKSVTAQNIWRVALKLPSYSKQNLEIVKGLLAQLDGDLYFANHFISGSLYHMITHIQKGKNANDEEYNKLKNKLYNTLVFTADQKKSTTINNTMLHILKTY